MIQVIAELGKAEFFDSTKFAALSVVEQHSPSSKKEKLPAAYQTAVVGIDDPKTRKQASVWLSQIFLFACSKEKDEDRAALWMTRGRVTGADTSMAQLFALARRLTRHTERLVNIQSDLDTLVAQEGHRAASLKLVKRIEKKEERATDMRVRARTESDDFVAALAKVVAAIGSGKA